MNLKKKSIWYKDCSTSFRGRYSSKLILYLLRNEVYGAVSTYRKRKMTWLLWPFLENLNFSSNKKINGSTYADFEKSKIWMPQMLMFWTRIGPNTKKYLPSQYSPLNSVHFKKPVTRSSFLSKRVVIFVVVILKMTMLFERNEDHVTGFLKWTDFSI